MSPSHQHQPTESFHGHADGYVVFRLVAKFGDDQSLAVGFARAAVGHKEKVRFGAGKQLRDSGKTFAVGSGPAASGELFRRGTAKGLVKWPLVAAFPPFLQQVPEFTTVQLPAELQKFVRRNVDMNVAGLPLSGRTADVVGRKDQMDLSNGKGIIETLHKTTAGVFADDLILIPILIHLQPPLPVIQSQMRHAEEIPDYS